jgi:hypothetical protein
MFIHISNIRIQLDSKMHLVFERRYLFAFPFFDAGRKIVISCLWVEKYINALAKLQG